MSFTFLVTFFVFITRSFINILEFIKQQSFQVYLLDHHHSGVGCLGLTGGALLLLGLRALDVEVEELGAREVGLEVLAGQLVQRHDAEHRRLPHRGLNVVVRLSKEKAIYKGGGIENSSHIDGNTD